MISAAGSAVDEHTLRGGATSKRMLGSRAAFVASIVALAVYYLASSLVHVVFNVDSHSGAGELSGDTKGDSFAPPSFIILGAQKAGTTYAMQTLNKHPEIFVWDEPHFIDNFWRRGPEWYKRQLATSSRKPLRGEKTPELIYLDKCAERVKQVAPDGKFILFLRDPVHRAYSAWSMNTRHGLENSSFASAIRRNLESLGERRTNRAATTHYVQRGFYMDQIERWLKVFPDRSRLLIVIAERLRAEPVREFGRIFAHLGASNNKSFVDAAPANYSKSPPPPPTGMKASVENELRDLYESHNQRLYSFLGFRIAEWETPRRA